MEGENIHADISTSLKDLEATPKEPEQPVAIKSTSTEWPVLLDSQESLKNGQRTPNDRNNNSSATPVSWTIKEKTVEEHERDRVGKYTQYFQDNTILPIPYLVAVA